MKKDERKIKKLEIEVTLRISMFDDWYLNEGLSERERIKLYKEDFQDLEVLMNNITPDSISKVKIAYKK